MPSRARRRRSRASQRFRLRGDGRRDRPVSVSRQRRGLTYRRLHARNHLHLDEEVAGVPATSCCLRLRSRLPPVARQRDLPLLGIRPKLVPQVSGNGSMKAERSPNRMSLRAHGISERLRQPGGSARVADGSPSNRAHPGPGSGTRHALTSATYSPVHFLSRKETER